MTYLFVVVAVVAAGILDWKCNKCRALGTVVVLAATALVIVWYAGETRTTAQATQDLASETRTIAQATRDLASETRTMAQATRDLASETTTMAQATRDLAEEAPKRHALWNKRLDLYTRLAGTLNLYLTSFSHKHRTLTPGAEQLMTDVGVTMAREAAEAQVIIKDEDDPVYKVLTGSIYPLREQLKPAISQEQRDENLRKVGKALADWRTAVRQSLDLPKLEVPSHKYDDRP